MKLERPLGCQSEIICMKPVNNSILVSRKAVSKLKPMNSSSQEPAEKLDGGAILVIDDNFAVREALLTILCLLPGMTVFTAANGQEGLQIVQQQQIDLVVLDLNMPVMNGEQTYMNLQQIAPEVKVIVSSSLSQHEAQLRFGERKLPPFAEALQHKCLVQGSTGRNGNRKRRDASRLR
ncbi:MAG: response regulator transcription factor [Chloroflexi bacterium]|nr:response regulator transcription factor [Chloroflexota bacterium]